jgi:hypothetical protein
MRLRSAAAAATPCALQGLDARRQDWQPGEHLATLTGEGTSPASTVRWLGRAGATKARRRALFQVQAIPPPTAPAGRALISRASECVMIFSIWRLRCAPYRGCNPAPHCSIT